MTYEILVKVNGRFEWLIASYELTAEQGKNLHMLGWSKINVDRATYENSIFFFLGEIPVNKFRDTSYSIFTHYGKISDSKKVLIDIWQNK